MRADTLAFFSAVGFVIAAGALVVWGRFFISPNAEPESDDLVDPSETRFDDRRRAVAGSKQVRIPLA